MWQILRMPTAGSTQSRHTCAWIKISVAPLLRVNPCYLRHLRRLRYPEQSTSYKHTSTSPLLRPLASLRTLALHISAVRPVKGDEDDARESGSSGGIGRERPVDHGLRR